MQEGGLKPALKRAIGLSLAAAAGDACMRTRCQDVVPKALSGDCKEAGRGRHARLACKPLLVACQQDAAARAACTARCARYFTGDDLPMCERDCNLARCRAHTPYDACVAAQTLRDVLACFERTACRKAAEDCLRDRCGLHPADDAPLREHAP